MNAYIEMWKKGLRFTGRTRRRDFWLASLVNYVIFLVLSFGAGKSQPADFLVTAYSVAFILPQNAMTMRRLHDSNRSGGWVLLYFVPVIGWIILLIFLLIAGTPGENRFGTDPKAFDSAL